MWEKFQTWAVAHPYLLGGLVFGVGLLLLWWFGFFGSKQQSSGNGTAAAYYAAETAAQNAAAATTIAQGQTQAVVGQTNAQRDVALAQIAASQEVADTQSGNQLAATKIQADYLTAAAASATTMKANDNLTAEHIATINSNSNESIANINATLAEQLNRTNQTAAINMEQTKSYENLISTLGSSGAALEFAKNGYNVFNAFTIPSGGTVKASA